MKRQDQSGENGSPRAAEHGASSRASQPPANPPPDACPICGEALLGVHCKLICRNCGYREDCSDLFAME